jgi:deoxycytidylate deaminase
MASSRSIKFVNILARLPAFASKSTNQQHHCAVVIKNGVPVAFGINVIKGCEFLHAEVNAILNYLKQQGIRSLSIKQARLYERPEKQCILHG